MRLRFWRRQETGETEGSRLGRLISHRAFLKTAVAALGGAVIAPLAMPPKGVQARYYTGTPYDRVNTNLRVQGYLLVDQNAAIGTSTQLGMLHVAGDVYVNSTLAIGSDGVVKACYYAQ